ncbi:MAG: AAA family ATPase, partial [Solirubrobacterales bacterium]
MLHELRIENLLLIERAELRLEPGLNAITGETGAGKTVLAHSLDLLMGGRARPQIVRPGAEEAWVEGVFALPPGTLDDPELAAIAERLPEDADEVVLGRRIGSSGRTSAFIGGRSASAAELRELGSRLLAFYGQHEHRKLMLASAQLEILDGFAGVELLELRDRYRAAHAEAAGLARELAELHEREGARERDLDLMRFELSEIEAAAPSVEEGAELESERGLLRNAEGRRTAAARALAAIGGDEADGGGAVAALAEADSGLAGAAGADPELDQLAERLRAAAVELDDVARDLRSYLDGIDGEPGRLESVE